jgi:hypothetical protein
MRIVVSVVIFAGWSTVAVRSFLRPQSPPHADIRPRATTTTTTTTMGKDADDAEFDILPRSCSW